LQTTRQRTPRTIAKGAGSVVKFLFICLYAAIAVYAANRYIKARRAAENDLLDYSRADQYIETLNKKRLRLNSIEQLLTDIEAHRHGQGEQPIIIQWFNAIGEQQTTQIYMNESPAVNKALRELIAEERHTLRCSLSFDLLNVPLRRNGNVTKRAPKLPRIFKRGSDTE
jgi:hypothetical protein